MESIINRLQIGKYLLVVLAIVAALFIGVGVVSADGNDSPEECKGTNSNVISSQTGTDDEVTVDVGEGNEVDGVCIKSGKDSIDGEKHSDVITADGTYAEGCYTVSGIGTQSVTVTRNEENSDCKAISHIDVLWSPVDDDNGDDDEDDEDENGEVLGEDEQVVTPAGAVSAGGGGGSAVNAVATSVAIVGSLALAGFGAYKLKELN